MSEYVWIDNGRGRQIRKRITNEVIAVSDFPCPRLMLDETPPLTSMADGKIYTSKAAMRQSYKASNNPKGINYTEVGDDKSFTSPTPKPLKRADRADIKDTIERAKADVNRGMYNHIE